MATKKTPQIGEWIAKVQKTAHVKCPACLAPAPWRKELGEILDAMIAARAFGVSIPDILARLADACPGGPRLNPGSMRTHLAGHDSARWRAAKGRAK